MNRYFIFLIMLVLATQTNVAAQTSTLLNETNTQIPDSCKPVVPKDTIFYPLTNTDDKVFVTIEEMPQFPGGDKALMDFVKANTIYPATAAKDSVYGRVIVRFAVGTGGCPARVSILRGIRADLDNESIRVIKMLPKFKPGTSIRQSPKGWYRTPVDVWYMVPFNYRLKKDPAAWGIEILPKE
jgi:TonB family protein